MKNGADLFLYLRRNQDRVYNTIEYNGSTTTAQSDDVVAKTAYDFTVNGGVTIGSDSNGAHMEFDGNIGTSLTGTITGLDNRKEQTMSFWFVHSANLKALSAYDGLASLTFLADGKLQFELQGTSSIRLKSTTALTIGEFYCVTARINNDLPSGTARVEADGDLFINGVKDTLETQVIGTNTGTNTMVYIGAYNSTVYNLDGKIYVARFYSTALSDADIASEYALGLLPSVRSDVVFEINGLYYLGTALLPTSMLDVKAFTASTPIGILVTYKSDGAGVGTGGIVGTPHATIVDDDGLTGRHTVLGLAYYEDGSQVSKLYLDGVEQVISGELVISGPAGTNYINIGSSDGATDFFDGQIKEVKVFLGVMTETDAINLCNGLGIVPENCVLFTYPRREIGGTTDMDDKSGNGYDFTITL